MSRPGFRLCRFRLDRRGWQAVIILLVSWLCLVQRPLQAGSEFSPDDQLKVIRTEHFDIFYVEGESEAAAAEVAGMVEQVRDEVLTSLGFQNTPRYDILIINNYDYSNGSASGYPTRVIRLYLTVPGPPVGGSSDISDLTGNTWLMDLFRHEFTHAAHLSHFSGWTPAWKYLFHGNPFYHIYPSWFVEGLAVAQETLLGQRGRGRTSTSEMFLRTAALDGSLLQVSQWSDMTGWPRGGARYLYGGAFLTYVARRFGPESLGNVVDAANRTLPYLDDARLLLPGKLKAGYLPPGKRLRRLPLAGLERAFWKATGVPLYQLVKDWKNEVTTQSKAVEARVHAEGLTPLERLSTAGGGTRSPACAPGGDELAWVAGPDDGLPGIYTRDRAGKLSRRLERNDIVGTLRYGVDGRKLYYSRLYDTEAPLKRSLSLADVFALDLTTGKEQRVSHGARLKDPTPTPDGLALIAVSQGAGLTRLERLSLADQSREVLFAPDRRLQLSTPSVSPDGRRVAVSVFVQQAPPEVGQYLLGILELESKAFELIPGTGVNREPTWLDNDHLLFVSDRSGISNLYQLDLRTRETLRLTNVLSGLFQPCVQAGGDKRLVARAYFSNGFDIVEAQLPEPLKVQSGLGTSPSTTLVEVPAEEGKMDRLDVSLAPLPALPEPVSAPYYPQLEARLSTVYPFFAHDGGAESEAYPGGMTFGVASRLFEPSGRHELAFTLEGGLSSHMPLVDLAYTNRSLAFPLGVFTESRVEPNGSRFDESLGNYQTWRRVRSGGLGFGLPFAWGATGMEFSAAGAYVDTLGFDVTGTWGTGDYVVAQESFSLWRAFANSWRVTRGHFLTLGMTQVIDDALAQSFQAGAIGQYQLRLPVPRGSLDFKLQGGYSPTALSPIFVGGTTGDWALPGVKPENGLSGVSAAMTQARLTVDLPRPQWGVGLVPLLFMERMDAVATVGTAGVWGSPGVGSTLTGVSLSLRSHLYSLRPGLSFTVEAGVGFDPQTHEPTMIFSLGGWPGLYYNLLPVGLPWRSPLSSVDSPAWTTSRAASSPSY